MKIYFQFILMQLCYNYQCSTPMGTHSTSTKIKPELKKNILNFGYGINYKYEGVLAHLFGRFNVVTKFILPSIGDLNFSELNYDDTCAYLDNKNIHDTKNKEAYFIFV